MFLFFFITITLQSPQKKNFMYFTIHQLSSAIMLNFNCVNIESLRSFIGFKTKIIISNGIENTKCGILVQFPYYRRGANLTALVLVSHFHSLHPVPRSILIVLAVAEIVPGERESKFFLSFLSVKLPTFSIFSAFHRCISCHYV